MAKKKPAKMDFSEYRGIKKARALLEQPGLDACLHACLHVRMTLEEMIFRKLQFYSHRYGMKQLFADWRATQGLKILCQLDPLADQGSELRMAKEDADGNPTGQWLSVGVHEAFRAHWANKHWNKIGSYLHFKHDKPEIDESEFRAYLDEILVELERVAACKFISDFAETVSIDCKRCGETVVANTKAIPQLTEVVCPTPTCRATYFVEQTGSQWGFGLKTKSAPCLQCGEFTPILDADCEVGREYACEACGTQHRITLGCKLVSNAER